MDEEYIQKRDLMLDKNEEGWFSREELAQAIDALVQEARLDEADKAIWLYRNSPQAFYIRQKKRRAELMPEEEQLHLKDRVMHDFSKVYGTVTGKRLKEPYRYRVLWDGDDFTEDWYKREVLVKVEGEQS